MSEKHKVHKPGDSENESIAQLSGRTGDANLNRLTRGRVGMAQQSRDSLHTRGEIVTMFLKKLKV